MGLALLPFFQFFRGTPHQLAAIKQLEESMPPELLEEHEADWFQAWKESGYDQQIYMPYFSSSTTRLERDTASVSAQQLRWWQRFTRRFGRMMSTTRSVPSTETPRR